MNKKLEIAILFFLILIVLGISFRLYNTSKNLNCDDCILTFRHQLVFQDYYTETNISINKLYEGYKNDKCPIFWDNVNGYMKNG